MRRRDAVAGVAFPSLMLVLGACGASAPASSQGGAAGVCGGQTGVSSATTQNYVVVLVATTQAAPGLATPSGPASPTPQPPTVVSGTEAAVSGAGATHFELHICNRATGAVATGLHPDVTLRKGSAAATPIAVPVAVLEDAGQGENGTAYGNNVRLEQEETYAVIVRIDDADSATLSYAVPITGPTGTPQPGCLDNHQLC